MGRTHSQASYLGSSGGEKSLQILSLTSWYHRRKGREGGKVNNWDCHCHGPTEIASDLRPLSLICIPWNPNLSETVIWLDLKAMPVWTVLYFSPKIGRQCILKGQLLLFLNIIWWQLLFDCVSSCSCCALSLGVSLLCNLPQRTSFSDP